MADMKETAIFELKLDYGATLKKIEEAEKEIQRLKEGQKEYNKQAKEGAFASDEVAKKTLEYRNALKELQAEQKAEQRLLDLYIKQTVEAAGSNNQLRAQLSFLTAQYNELGKAERENEEVGGKLQKQLRALSDELKANEKAIGDNRRNVGTYTEGIIDALPEIKQYANSLAGLEEKLRDLKDAQKNMDVDSTAFQETQGSIDDTTVKLGILGGKFDEFGNREPRNPQAAAMDSIADATVGAVSAFEVYNLTMGDSEEQSAAQERALRAIAIAQNLRNVQIGIANAGEAAHLVITKASAFALQAQTKATVIATGVQRVFNLVLKANPIGLIITAVALLAAGFVFLTDKFKIGTKVVDFMNEKFAGFMKIVQSVGESLGLLDSANDKALANFGRLTEGVEANIRVLEAQGGKEKEIYALREKLAQDELTLLRRKLTEKGELDKEELKRFRELKTDLEVLRLEEKARLAKAAEDDKKEAEKQQKDRLKEQQERVKEAQDANKLLLEDGKALIEARLLQTKEGSRRYLELQERLVRQQLKIENSNADLTRNQRKYNELKANADILKLRSEFYKAVALEELKYLGELDVYQESGNQQAKDRLTEMNRATFDAMEERRQAVLAKEDEINQAKIEAAKLTADKLREIENERLDVAIEASNALSSLVEIAAGQSEETAEFQRAIAVFQIGVSSARAIAEGVANAAAAGPFPANLLAIATTVATVLANIAQAKALLSESNAPKAPKFARGGYTGTGYGTPDESGYKVAGIVHEGEYVAPKKVVNDPKAKPLLAALEELRYKKLRGFDVGGFASPVAGINLSIPRQQVNMDQALQPPMVRPATPLAIDYRQLAAAMKDVTIVTQVRDITAKQAGVIYTENRSSVK